MVLPPNHPKSDRFSIETYGDLGVLHWHIESPLGMGKPLSSSEDQTSRKSLPQMYLRRRSFEKISGGSLNMCTPNHPK